MDDPVEVALLAIAWLPGVDINDDDRLEMRRALAAACEAKADSLSAPLPGNAYPLEWQEIVQGFLREWAREMKATNPSS